MVKITHMWRRWDTTQNFFLAFIDVLEKQIFIKNLFSMLQEKKLGDIIILHLCTKNLNDMIYSFWDKECDRLKMVILGHFQPFNPHKNKKKSKLKKKKRKKLLEISSFSTCVSKITIMMYSFHDLEHNRQDFFSLWTIFYPFTLQQPRK